MEEIDIIELLKRVKEGKAPKKIQISVARYELNGELEELEEMDIGYLYLSEKDGRVWIDEMQPEITVQTKIKILDKPIIEELRKVKLYDDNRALIIENRDKINEIINRIGKEEK